MVYKLSPSAISLMKECRRCFWLEKHRKWSRPSSIFPSLPSGMDSVLKKHFDSFRDRNLLPPELCGKGKCENMRLFGDNNEEKELLKDWRNNLKGIRYEDEKGNILFGAVDNILVENNKLIVLDYKTRGFPLKENSHHYYQDQLDIYNFLLKSNGYNTSDFSYLLFYIPDKVNENGEVIFDTKLIKIDVNPLKGKLLFDEALDLLNSSCPDKRCQWCERVEFDQ